ncbi:sensor histidine kinase [Nocardioides cavernae]|uniref:Sensor histidine kinase n=1 Tax=Nocardioides cavernae TaxID=1921566 RepID=A0ABR8N8E4_9ACTN|nr:sensor histidine kinase [Nocardioides cavernae]MBD3924408.1 sensor histidine kinase [Nocardioides cavernae]MBM7510646.1 anti-sigma regulatory factor (Ser/Thr protein kinase) [Nocardioides cavernae]
MTMPATHTSLLYDSDRHYASEAGSFVRDGLEQGHRALVMAPPSRLELLQSELGRDAAEVTFVEDDIAYEPQWRAYRVLLDFAAEAPEVRSCVIAEQTLETRSPAELVDYRRLESAINVVFAEAAVDLLCPYDAGRLPSDLLDIARHAHNGLRVEGSVAPNPAFADPMAVLAGLSDVAPPPPGATTLECSRHSDLAATRRLVRARGAEIGLDPDLAADVELALTEVLTNALLHGSPPALVHLYEEADMWVCHVQDGGRLPVDPLAGVLPPAEPSEHGYGLWLARQLVAAVDVGTDRTGTHVRLHARMPG